MEIDHEIISMVILPFPLIQVFKGSCQLLYKWAYSHKDWLTTKRTKPAQEECEYM